MTKITDQHARLAYRKDPYTEVRIVCTDACEVFPIISVEKGGVPYRHHADGSWMFSEESDRDLVPLQAKVEAPGELWVVIDPDGGPWDARRTEAEAREGLEWWADDWHPRTGSIVRYVPAETQKMEADE